MDIIFSLVIAFAGTISVLAAVMQGVESRRAIYIVAVISFLAFFLLSFYFDLSQFVPVR